MPNILPALRRPDVGQETIHFISQCAGQLGQFARCYQHLVGLLSGVLDRLVDLKNVGRNVPGAVRYLFGIGRDFLGRGSLFLDRRGNRLGRLAYRSNRFADAANRIDGGLGFGLDPGYLTADFVGRLRGLFGEAFDLARQNRETAANKLTATKITMVFESERFCIMNSPIFPLIRMIFLSKSRSDKFMRLNEAFSTSSALMPGGGKLGRFWSGSQNPLRDGGIFRARQKFFPRPIFWGCFQSRPPYPIV